MTEFADRIPLEDVPLSQPKETQVTKVKVGSSGVTVEIEGEGPYWEMVDKALEVFHRAGGSAGSAPGSAFGFSTALRYSPAAQPSSMWRPPRVGFTHPDDMGCDLRSAEIVNRSHSTEAK